MLLVVACIFLVIIHAVAPQAGRGQHYTQIKGKQMSGEVIYFSKVNVPLECGAACLQMSCDTYNIITTAEGILCQVIGDHLQQDLIHNPEADCYCK